VTITRNEMLYAVNQGDKLVLAIALVDEDDAIDGPYYVRNPFDPSRGGALPLSTTTWATCWPGRARLSPSSGAAP
jgi:hypothetical protein